MANRADIFYGNNSEFKEYSQAPKRLPRGPQEPNMTHSNSKSFIALVVPFWTTATIIGKSMPHEAHFQQTS